MWLWQCHALPPHTPFLPAPNDMHVCGATATTQSPGRSRSRGPLPPPAPCACLAPSAAAAAARQASSLPIGPHLAHQGPRPGPPGPPSRQEGTWEWRGAGPVRRPPTRRPPPRAAASQALEPAQQRRPRRCRGRRRPRLRQLQQLVQGRAGARSAAAAVVQPALLPAAPLPAQAHPGKGRRAVDGCGVRGVCQ